ncbi:MAG: hypothetical protein ACP6IP_10320 [Candidatus Njordarchaeia archaeon]
MLSLNLYKTAPLFNFDETTSALILTILAIIIILLPLLSYQIYKIRKKRRKEIPPFVIKDTKKQTKNE